MIEDIKSNFEDDELHTRGRNRMLQFISCAIATSIVMVFVSMYLYNTSGASQLDLSRPGYKSVRSRASSGSSDFQSFSETGSVDQSTIDEFKGLYENQTSKIKSYDAFGKDTLNPDLLGIYSDSASTPE